MLVNVELEKLKWNEEKRYWEGTDEVVLGEANSLESALDIKLDDKTLVYASTGNVEGVDTDVYSSTDINDLYRIVRVLEHGEQLLEQDEVLLRSGRIPRAFGFEHFRLEFKLTGEMTNEVPLITTLLRDGLYIVNPDFKLSKSADIIMTEEEYYDRFIYTETAVIDTRNRTVTFFNGDGWEYIVGFDDIVGTAAVALNNVMIQVILVTKYIWNR